MSEAAANRFEAPKASIFLNSKGQLSLGLPEKPIFRPLRSAFEAAKAEECKRAEEVAATNVKQKCRLHDLYMAHIKEEANVKEAHGNSASGIARVYYNGALQTSSDNPLQNSEVASLPEKPFSPRKLAAVPANATSLELNCMPVSPTRGMRFAGRTMFATQHLHDRDRDGRPHHQSPRLQAQCAAAERQLLEMKLLQEYPHGLPASKLREAKGRGMHIGGLGYGIGGKSAIIDG